MIASSAKKHELLDKFLNANEKTQLGKLAENKALLSALRKVLLFDIYYNGTLKEGEAPDPARNFALGMVATYGHQLSDEFLGRSLRAQWEGIM